MEQDAAKKKSEAFKKMKAGMKVGMAFSGKDLFDFNPEWADAGDDNAMDYYEREGSDNEAELNAEAGSSLLPDDLAGLESSDEEGEEYLKETPIC